MPWQDRDLPKQERPLVSIGPLEGGDNGQSCESEDDESHAPSFGMEQDDRVRLIGEVIQTMHGRDALIIAGRFGLNGSRRKTLGEIGQDLNLTKERVRQIELGPLNRLRYHLIMIGQDKI